MTEAEWLSCEDPRQGFAHVQTCATKRQSRLLAFACCRGAQCYPQLGERSRRVIALMELLADGLVTEDDLRATTLPPVMNFGCADGDFNLADSFLEPDLFQVVWASVTLGNGTSSCSRAQQAHFLRDIFGNPFRPAIFAPEWRTDNALALARQMYESRDFSAMPILADALQDAGCEIDDIMTHCRGPGPHVRGCWVVDAVLNKE